jgi:hypothetical protein
MLAHLVLSVAASVALMQDPGSAVVWGQVRSFSTGAPLRFAVIEVVMAGQLRIQSETDSTGIYVLQGVPPGRRLIRATHLDHAPHEIEVSVVSGQQKYVDFDLEVRPVKLPTVTARANALTTGLRDTLSTTEPEIGPATVRVLEATPGVAEHGLADAANEVPGHEPVDPSDVLFVRGGAADLKLVLLNGAPVYAPFHIGGLINALDVEMLRSVTLYLGGAPARYDGGLSYVMDLETRSGRTKGRHADVGMDILAARGLTEGPIGSSGSYLIGGRAVHGLGATPFVTGPFPYTYGDGLARFDIDFEGGGTLSLTGFWNRENVRLDSAGAPEQIARWGNDAGSLRYRGEIGGAEALVTLAAGNFRTELPLRGLKPLVTQGNSRRMRAAADFTRAFGSARVFYGASFDRMEFDQRAVSLTDSTETLSLHHEGKGDVTGLYAEGRVSASSRVQLRGGLRADVFSLSPSVRVAPRLSATILLTDRAALTLAGGRYRQYVRVPDDELVTGAAVADERDTRALTVASATHFVLAFDQDLGEGMGLGIEGFFKNFDELPSPSGERAKATGVDLWVRRSSGIVTGWFGYSLAWVWSPDAEEAISRTPNPYSGRHLVSAGVSGPMIGGGNFDIRVAYGAGLPFTAIPEPEVTTPVFGTGLDFAPAATLSSEPVPTLPSEPNQRYLRLDAQLARTWTGDWRGLAFEFTPYLKVLNALDRRDAIFYHFDRNDTNPEPRALAALPVLPVVGVQWKF